MDINRTIEVELIFTVSNSYEKMELTKDIHCRLVGNEDYINSNIVLDTSEDDKVRLVVYKECKTKLKELLGD